MEVHQLLMLVRNSSRHLISERTDDRVTFVINQIDTARNYISHFINELHSQATLNPSLIGPTTRHVISSRQCHFS